MLHHPQLVRSFQTQTWWSQLLSDQPINKAVLDYRVGSVTSPNSSWKHCNHKFSFLFQSGFFFLFWEIKIWFNGCTYWDHRRSWRHCQTPNFDHSIDWVIALSASDQSALFSISYFTFIHLCFLWSLVNWFDEITEKVSKSSLVSLVELLSIVCRS